MSENTVIDEWLSHGGGAAAGVPGAGKGGGVSDAEGNPVLSESSQALRIEALRAAARVMAATDAKNWTEKSMNITGATLILADQFVRWLETGK